MALQVVSGSNGVVVDEATEARPVRRVLIVDDEENVRNAMRRSLRKEGYELHFAEGPREALELMSQHPIDLVLSDHMMPQMTGMEFLTLVHDRYPEAMRLMLTGHADMETAIRAINQGEIYRFLTKPWDDAELKVTLFMAFERQDLERENRRLLATVRRQQLVIVNLEREHPGIGQVMRDSDGAILLSEDELQQLAVAR